MDEVLAKNNAFMEDLYQRNPSLRPSASDTLAEKLRAAADNVEYQQMHENFIRFQAEKMQKLQNCRPIVYQKTSH